MVHHVGHVGHVEAAELWAVAQHHVSDLGDEHALSQPLLQVHEEPAGDHMSSRGQTRPRLPRGVRLVGGSELFAGRRDATDVGEQGVVLQPGQGLSQWLGRVEVVDDHPEAP